MLKCDKCGQVTTYNDSKTVGRGGTMRIDKVCADNQRTLQRRVKDRPKADPLRVWWKQLPQDPEKEKRWYLRMKETRKKNRSLDDQSLMAFAVEVKSTGVETRNRAEYYGYGTIVEDNPDWTEEKCLEHWKNLVARSKDKITDEDGETLIRKAKKVIIDFVDSNMHQHGIKRKLDLEGPDAIKQFEQQAVESMKKFQRTLQAMRPIRSPETPSEAMQVIT